MTKNAVECKKAKKDMDTCNDDIKAARQAAAKLARKYEAGEKGVTLADVNTANEKVKTLEKRMISIANRTKEFC